MTTGNSFDDRIMRRYKELVSDTYEEPVYPIYRGIVGINADDDMQIRKSLSSIAAIPSSRPSSSKSGKSSKSEKKQGGILQFCRATEQYDHPDDDEGPRPPKTKKRIVICISF